MAVRKGSAYPQAYYSTESGCANSTAFAGSGVKGRGRRGREATPSCPIFKQPILESCLTPPALQASHAVREAEGGVLWQLAAHH